MTREKHRLWFALVVLIASPAMAQDGAAPGDTPDPATLVEAERAVDKKAETIEMQMREAEKRLAEAAARVAELSSQRLPTVTRIERGFRHTNRPVIGVAIGSSDEQGRVDGVTVQGVTPGSAAAAAGLRAGDVITAVNGESLEAESDSQANDKMLDFMAGVEEGDTLDIDYRRDGEDTSVEVKPEAATAFSFAFPPNLSWHRAMPAPPAAPGPRWFGFFMGGGNWGDMEMVSLTGELGRYFGTDTGLLVVRAPADDDLQLQDGDVIQSIDGREPTSVSHAMRILGSYQGGETLEIEIMRDKERETLSIDMPDRRQGFRPHHEFRAPRSGAAVKAGSDMT